MQEVTPESKQELIIKAQQVYKFSVANAGKARLSASENTSRDIDVSLLFPDWDRNGTIQNSKGQNVLGVFLKKTNKEYWEANFLFIGGASVLIIKKFTFKDNCLTIYNRAGKFLGKGVYDPETKIFDMFLTRQELSKQARISGEGKTRRKKKVDVKAGTETRYDVTITLYVGSGGGGFNIGDATSISVEGYDDEEGDDDENSEGNDDPFQNMDNGEEGFEIPDGSIVNESVVSDAPVAKTFDDYYQDRLYHDYLLGLNDAELTFFRNHPSFIPDAYMNKINAESLANRYWVDGNGDGNNGNAFKHALWSALNAKSFGIDLAKELALAHESGPDNPPIQYKMDMHNNYLGISLYTYLKNNYPYELSGYLLGMTINGSITNGAGYRIVNEELVSTNSDGYIE